jgi:hypothetical protein
MQERADSAHFGGRGRQVSEQYGFSKLPFAAGRSSAISIRRVLVERPSVFVDAR